MMLEGAGFEVSNLSAETDPSGGVCPRSKGAWGLFGVHVGALGDDTLHAGAIEALKENGLRDRVKVVVEGCR